MVHLAGYTLGSRLPANGSAEVFSAVRDADGQTVIVKVYPADAAHNGERVQRLLQWIGSPGAPKPLGLESQGAARIAILERLAGAPLPQLLAGGPPPLASGLAIACGMARALVALQAADVVHESLCPSQVLVVPGTFEVHLVGFDRAYRLGMRPPPPRRFSDEQIRYAAPETLGRLSAKLDFRADLYAFGWLLHELLGGRPADLDLDPHALLQKKLEGPPGDAALLAAGVPREIAQLAVSLCEPRAERRPASARQVLEVLAAHGAQRPATAAPTIVKPLHFRPPASLAYAREGALRSLYGAYADVSQGHSRLSLIVGPSGVGRKTLAAGLAAEVAARGGYFIQGSCDPDRPLRPYLALRRAFASFVAQVEAEGGAALDVWRQTLEERLGDLLSVIADAIPELRSLIGKVGAPELRVARDARHRLRLAARHMFRALADPARPLVLALENVQWLDPASAELLEGLLSSRDPEGMLVVATCEDVEEMPAKWREGLEQQGVACDVIRLAPIGLEDLASALGAEFGCADAEALSLARWTLRHTANESLRVEQLFAEVDARGGLRRAAEGEWLAAGAPLGEWMSAPALLAERIQKSAQRRLLVTAACLGDRFGPEEVEELLGGDAPARGWIAPLVEARLLSADRAGLCFAHEALRAAARGLLPAAEAAELSRRAARLRAKTRAAPCAFAAADLARAELELGGSADAEALCFERCLAAGRRALELGAAEAAADYLEAAYARAHVAPPAAAIEAELLLADAALLRGASAAASERLESAWSRVSEPAGIADVATRRMCQLGLESSAEAAVAIGLEALQRLGVTLRADPSRWRLSRRFARLGRRLRRGGRAALSAPSSAPDAGPAAVLDVLLALIEWSDLVSAPLAAQAVCTALELALRWGELRPNTSALLLAWYAQLEPLITRAPPVVAEDAAAAEALGAGGASHQHAANLGSRLRVDSWISHRRKLPSHLRTLQQAMHLGGEVDLHWQASFWRAYTMALVGTGLGDVEAAFLKVGARHREVEERRALAHACVRACARLSGTNPSEAAGETELGEAASRLLCGTLNLVADCVLGQYDVALERSEEFAPLADRVLATSPQVSEFYLMRGLAAAAQLEGLGGRARRRMRAIALNSRARLAAWSRSSPENFEHQELLLAAELERAEGRPAAALCLYGRAADRGDVEGYVHHAGLAQERRARLSFELGLESEATHFLRQAAASYAGWGATVKAEQLQSEYSGLGPLKLGRRAGRAERPASKPTTHGTTTVSSASTGSVSEHTLDLETVLRSSEAISQEIELDRVLERVLATAIENAGARRAILLLERDSGLRIEAESSLDSTAHPMQLPLALESSRELVPVNLVQYVQRTRNTVVLGNAASEGLFTDDPYISGRGSKSLLCVPVVRQSKLIGVLYLENDLVTDAFTEDRVEVLGLLSSHAAISLDNARLYHELTELNRDLEGRVEERTRQLREARDAAESATRAKSEFLAVMSHEIRTPMNVVIGMAQLLLDGRLTSEQLECIRAVQTAGDSLLTIINDILDFSKIEAGKLELERTGFSLRQCVDDVTQLLASRAQDKKLEFPVFVERGCPDGLLGDPGRLRQVLINFVGNAVKFTEAGQVEIFVALLQDHPTSASLRFEVRDTGIGIPPEALGRLFQSFSQVSVSTTRKYGGTGLGLVISKRLVEAMGGAVGVESEERRGSTFWFELKLDKDPGAAALEPLPGVEELEVFVVGPHARSNAGICEQLVLLGARAHAALTLEEVGAELDRAPEAGAAAPPRMLLLRYPFAASDPDELRWLSADGAPAIFLMPTNKERRQAQLGSLPIAGMVTRPTTLSSLHAALAGRLDVRIGAQRALSGAADVEAASHFRILLAEDYELNQRLAVRLLERAGYVCDVVENGRLALEATASGAYDLILMDCQMPEMDGFEATRRIREREVESGAHIAIVAMTANAMMGDRERCLEAGMDDYLAKPIRVDALHEMLRKYLAGRQRT